MAAQLRRQKCSSCCRKHSVNELPTFCPLPSNNIRFFSLFRESVQNTESRTCRGSHFFRPRIQVSTFFCCGIRSVEPEAKRTLCPLVYTTGITQNPSEQFPVLEIVHTSNDRFYAVQKRRSTDFEALIVV